MRREDMLISVRSRRLTCVLDPALVLASPWGTALALRLPQVTEPWLTRSFWQVIDASELVLPGLVSAEGATGELAQPATVSLQTWITLRDQTDAASWPFRWVGDNLAQSQVGEASDGGVVERYELLADALAKRFDGCEQEPGGFSLWWNPMQAALDALALSATLSGALVLTAQAGSGAPWPVDALNRVGIPVKHLDPPPNSLFAAERILLRDSLVAAGLASLVQYVPRLVALHVMAGAPAFALSAAGGGSIAEYGSACRADQDQAADPWRCGEGWWYYV